MATILEIASARLQNADVAIKAANDVGLPLVVAFALLDMESEGRNFFGSDAGGMFKGETVTQAKFEAMEKAVAAGKPSNGVGPTQVTWHGFFPQARAQGLKLWLPYDNMVFGFKLIKGYLDKYPGDYQKVGRLYNGKDSYGNTFVRVVGEWKSRLSGAGEETPVATYYVAPALVELRSEINSEWPGRDKSTDGALGDAAHAARKSEHNPEKAGKYKGRVNAIDVDTSDIDFAAILPKLKADPRTWYVIHKGYIYSRTYNFAKRKYTGANSHSGHFHISIYPGKAGGESKAPWGIHKAKPVPVDTRKTLPVLNLGDKNELVSVIKRFFGGPGVEDGPIFDQALTNTVKGYQRSQGLVRDGVVGKQTWTSITKSLTIPGYKP